MSSSVRLYEGLFLLNQQTVASDLDGLVDYVSETITRHEAELVVIRKWDERKLAYPIDKQKRGTFLLAYFNAPPSKIVEMEHDFNLSEQILRSLILRADHIGATELELAKKDAYLSLEVKLQESSVSENTGKSSAEKTEILQTESEATDASSAAAESPATVESSAAAESPSAEAQETAGR